MEYLSKHVQFAAILYCVEQHVVTWGSEKLAKMNYYLYLRYCGELQSGNWFITDVSGQRIGPIFKDRISDILALEDETNTVSQNVGNRLVYGV